MATIQTIDITENSLKGKGVFDELMSAAQLRLDEQFRLSRISGNDYSKVYLGSIQIALEQAIVFLLNKQRADKEADLLEQQILKTIAETDAVKQGKSNAVTEGLILELQRQKEEVALDLINAQLWAERAKTVTDPSSSTPPNTIQGLLGKQLEKINSEIALIDSKKASEQAQILDTVNGEIVTGIIGKQKSLYSAQTAGFARDAEQKLCKVLADTFTVRRTTDEGTVAPSGLTDADITDVFSLAKVGIGAPVAQGS